MVLPAILKRRHSLKDVNILPAIKRIRTGKPEGLKEFARMQKDLKTENLSFDEINQHVQTLTGEGIGEILMLAGRDEDVGEARWGLHCMILFANEFGQPKGQDLTPEQNPGTSEITADDTQSNTEPGSSGAGKRKRDGLEDRIAQLEKSSKVDAVVGLKEKELPRSYESAFVKVPLWEAESGFNPIGVCQRQKPAWVTLGGEIPSPTARVPSAESVLHGYPDFDLYSLPLRDPQYFVSGQIHNNLNSWRDILEDEVENELIKKWLENGVHVHDFFRHYKGNFKGRFFYSDVPPKQYFPNSSNCAKFVDFICNELYERIATGSIRLLGTIGECQPPKVIMPLTIEPTKPRLCHDERFLNLWVKDCPFKLETLRDIPRLVGKGSLMITCDEKSGYDHVKLDEESQMYFGIQFGGFLMTYTTLPFGWKASPYVYQSIGIRVTSYLRSLDVLNTLYIDDRFAVTKGNEVQTDNDNIIESRKLSYALLELLTRLGYTLSLGKCSLEPSSCKKFLGFLVDSIKQAFLLPEDKKIKFAELREAMLLCNEIDLRTLQRFCGKCISMSLAVPGCKLFCGEVNMAISQSIKNSRPVVVSDALKEELLYWKFLDGWSGYSMWRPEFHKYIELSTDASGFKYGAVVKLGDEISEFGDYWVDGDTRPIHVKEADAILKSLIALGQAVANSSVDLKTDNMPVIHSWNGQGSKCKMLNDILKAIFRFVVDKNVDLKLHYVPSKENIADDPSRKLDFSDCMLSENSWLLVEEHFGQHSVDLMSLDSNVMKSDDGKPLRHFTPWPTPETSGVNVFSQDLKRENNMYVYPPFVLIFPVLRLLEEQKVSCTIVGPEITPIPAWWPKLKQCTQSRIYIGTKGQKGVIKVPCRDGFVLDDVGLKWPLLACRISFVI